MILPRTFTNAILEIACRSNYELDGSNPIVLVFLTRAWMHTREGEHAKVFGHCVQALSLQAAFRRTFLANGLE